LMPQEPEVMGLLALMLYQHSRRDARANERGLVPLGEQNRALWDQVAIAEANALLSRAARHGVEGPYQVQAAIAAEHANAGDAGAVNWERIAALYTRLCVIAPSPVVDLNRAVAFGFAYGPAFGLAALDAIEPGELENYHPSHVARADFLRRLGRTDEARAALGIALRLVQNTAERAYLERRLVELD